jgi:hypothetical protein
MPAIHEAIDRMTTAEKFEAMDYLWASLSADSDGIPPAWHEHELARTAARVESGLEHPIPWPAARDILDGLFK